MIHRSLFSCASSRELKIIKETISEEMPLFFIPCSEKVHSRYNFAILKNEISLSSRQFNLMVHYDIFYTIDLRYFSINVFRLFEERCFSLPKYLILLLCHSLRMFDFGQEQPCYHRLANVEVCCRPYCYLPFC